MGSLMSGWDSPGREKFLRSKSLTREEIAAFWKSKKLKEEDEEEHLSVVVMHGDEEDERSGSQQPLEEDIPPKHGWWLCSNWAFLNQPPVLEQEIQKRRKHAAASQLHVAY